MMLKGKVVPNCNSKGILWWWMRICLYFSAFMIIPSIPQNITDWNKSLHYHRTFILHWMLQTFPCCTSTALMHCWQLLKNFHFDSSHWNTFFHLSSATNLCLFFSISFPERGFLDLLFYEGCFSSSFLEYRRFYFRYNWIWWMLSKSFARLLIS